MQINYALILSAGLGTRMGEIGKIIPKVLWPVFSKTLLELQIAYCRDLGIKNIYINTHYLHDEIVTFLKRSGLEKEVKVLHEETLLDSGGAVHNLAAQKEVLYKGNLLLVNGDQFLFFNSDYWDQALLKLQRSRAVLFGIEVDKNSSYNETVIKEDCLMEIAKNTTRNRDYITYSGLGLLKLDGLKETPGISKFFESVANYKSEVVQMVTPENFEYWDFGTAGIYAESILKLLSPNPGSKIMLDFLHKQQAFSGDLGRFVDQDKKAIDLEQSALFKDNCLYARGIFQSY